MGLLAYFRDQLAEPGTDKGAKELRQYILDMEGHLKNDWFKRVYGDGVYSGYNVLREFYKGKQWSFKKDGNGTMRTYNYTFTIVENMTAFLTNEPPSMSSPAKNITDPVQRALAEGRTKILSVIHEENGLSLVFQRAVRTGSINGDSFVFGAIPTFKVKDDGTKEFDSIRYWNIERPEHIRVIWKDENFTEMAGFVKHYRLEKATAEKLFKEQITKNKLRIVADQDTENLNQVQPTDIPMVTIEEIWMENEYLLLFNNDKKIVDYIKHDWGYVPLQYVPNIHLPGESKGTSDIENELDPQQEYNERASDVADIIKEIAKPAYWGKNLDNLTEVRSGQTVIYQVGDDGVINAMPKSGTTAPIEEYLKDRKNDIIGLSGLNQVLYPGSQVLQATGRALSVIMQGVNNKVSLRKEWWIQAFKNLNKSILFLAEKYIPDADKVIDGFYRSDVFISSVLLRSVSDEINKFQSKVQSLTTTQKNVGIENPSEEQKLMKEELEDEILATEIAKQPGLLHQILAARSAASTEPAVPGTSLVPGVNFKDQGGVGGGGAPGAVAPASPVVASESNNAPGNNPAPAPGNAVPVSQQGAINQAASRSGGAVIRKGGR